MIKCVFVSCCIVVAVLFSAIGADRAKTNTPTWLPGEWQTNRSNGFVVGQPTNNISIGIRFLNGSQSELFVCLLADPQANSQQFWVAPPDFQRVEYSLSDSAGKAISYLPTYRPPKRVYKTISEVPKNLHGAREGTMWPPFSMPYMESRLTDIFQIDHAGDFNLVVKGRIMEINGDSSLSLIEFPPVSLTLHLRQQDIIQAAKE